MTVDNDGDDPLSTGGAFKVLSGLAAKREETFVGRELAGYRIAGLIAEGGMGRVYRAERVDGSFEREVAIKFSIAGGVNRDLQKRFLQEQHILADMNHPSVANLYDAGTTDEGLSYLIMELVDGQDIEQFVSGADLDHRQIIELVLPLLDALGFAHARLVVHRDIKASNILVDAEGNARLLDFGIAKLLDEAPQAATHARPLSLVSASPEQLLGKPVTTASDIYQVGLLLHRLLLNRPALPARTMADAVQAAVDAKTFQLPADAHQALGTDLAAILGRCLQPDPADRYRDVSALRQDLENYLAARPVSVRSPTLAYRFAKLVQRNRLLAAAISVLVLVTIGGTVVYTMRINEARLAAEQEAAAAEQVIAFLTDIFESASPENNLGESLTARELLDRGVADIDERFADQPVIKARMQFVLANVYRELGFATEALPLSEAAYFSRRELLGPDDRRTLTAGNDLAIAYDHLNRPNDAIPLYLEVLERQRAAIGSDHVETMKTLNNLGAAYLTKGDYALAATYLEEALERRRRVLGDNHPEVGSTLTNLPIAYAYLGQMERAKQGFMEALQYNRRVSGDRSPSTIIALLNAGGAHFDTGEYETAARLLDEAKDAAKAVLGAKHRASFAINNIRAQVYVDRLDIVPSPADLVRAEKLLQDVRRNSTEVIGPENSEALAATALLAEVRNHQRRHDEALDLLESVVAAAAPKVERTHNLIIAVRQRLIRTYGYLQRYDDARSEYAELDALLVSEFGPDDVDRLRGVVDMAQVHARFGHRDKAAPMFREAAQRLDATIGADDPRARFAKQALEDFLRTGTVGSTY